MTRVVSRSFRRWAILVALCSCAVAVVTSAQPDPLQQAADHIRAERWTSAIEVLQATLERSPDEVRALNLLGIALSSSGRREEAHAQFAKAVALAPTFHPALKNLAVNEMSLGRVDEAVAHFRELLKAVPDDRVAHLVLAEAAFDADDFQAAVEHYEQSHVFERGDPALVLKLARSYQRAGRPEEAVSALARVPTGDPSIDQEAARLLVEMEAFAAAAARFESVLAASPDNYDVGFNLALARLRGERPGAAVRALQDLVERGHRTAELYNLLSRAYEATGETKQAYDALRAAIKVDPTGETHYVDLIALCLDHENLELAQEIADIGVAALPRSARLHRQRGIVMAMKGEFPAAQASFDAAATLSPDDGLSYVALGLVYLQMGRTPEAVATLRDRRRRSPEDALASWFLGEALYRSGAQPGSREEAEALQALNSAVGLQPDLLQAHLLLAKMLQRGGRLDRALEHLKRALALDPDNASTSYQLAQIYRRQGKTREANELFAKVRDMKADDRDELTRSGLLRIVREGRR
ncbi:MAG: tetratricopeptide repeat protein [Vicinamibacteraceae bacterium]